MKNKQMSINTVEFKNCLVLSAASVSSSLTCTLVPFLQIGGVPAPLTTYNITKNNNKIKLNKVWVYKLKNNNTVT